VEREGGRKRRKVGWIPYGLGGVQLSDRAQGPEFNSSHQKKLFPVSFSFLNFHIFLYFYKVPQNFKKKDN
jgi:hypothetical protein